MTSSFMKEIVDCHRVLLDMRAPTTTTNRTALTMKKLLLFIPLWAGLLTVSVQAGETTVSSYKNVAPAPPPPLYGIGFYGAIDAGANVYQNRGGTRVFENEFGDTLTIDPKNDVGFFGGLKAGYVFGRGVFRPTIEGDFFYNGFRGGANTTLA